MLTWDNQLIGPWVSKIVDTSLCDRMSSLGWLNEEGKLTAGVVYDHYTFASIAATIAIEGTITPVQAEKILLCKQHLDHLSSAISTVEEKARSIATPYADQSAIISSLPGIREFSTIAILSEIGADMSQFPSSKHLCSWAGLAPCNDQSAGKKKLSASAARGFI